MNHGPKLQRLRGQLAAARARLGAEKAALTAAQAEQAAVAQARAVAAAVAQAVQQQAHGAIASVVTRCLAAVFDDPYEFKIDFVQKRGKTEASPMFYRRGNAVDPLGGVGGGVLDVAAFGLRLAALCLTRPPVRRLVVLDEPFKFVAACYRHRVRALLEALAADLGVQFIIVTHIPELVCGTVIEVT